MNRSVKASQRGKAIFIMIASFAKLEVGQPEAQWPSFPRVKSPEESIDKIAWLQAAADREPHSKRRQYFLELQQVRIITNGRFL